MTTAARPVRRIGLIDWTHMLEDYLDSVGVTFREYREELDGGWLFGYVRALAAVGIDSVIIAISARVDAVTRFRHEPTGAPLMLLPAPRTYRRARNVVYNPYASHIDNAMDPGTGARRVWSRFVRVVVPYVATPLRTLHRTAEDEDLDALICQDYEHPRFDLVAALGRATDRPVYATFQGGDFRLTALESAIRPRTIPLAHGFLVGPSAERVRLTTTYRVTDTDVHQVFNPVDFGIWQGHDGIPARRRLGIGRRARTVVYHGRIMHHRKGLDVLLDAWDGLADDAENCVLILIGRGPDDDWLRDTIGRCSGRIVWHDEFVTDRHVLASLLAAGDVAVLPSRHEGFPVAPIEAMAGGLPLVASDLASIQDIAPEGRGHGVAPVPPGDADRLAAALNRLLSDTATARRLGVAARDRVERAFTHEAVGRQLSRAFGCRQPTPARAASRA